MPEATEVVDEAPEADEDVEDDEEAEPAVDCEVGPGLDELGVFPLNRKSEPAVTSAMRATTHTMNTARRRAITLRRRTDA
jgi:hypothetical protein